MSKFISIAASLGILVTSFMSTGVSLAGENTGVVSLSIEGGSLTLAIENGGEIELAGDINVEDGTILKSGDTKNSIGYFINDPRGSDDPYSVQQTIEMDLGEGNAGIKKVNAKNVVSEGKVSDKATEYNTSAVTNIFNVTPKLADGAKNTKVRWTTNLISLELEDKFVQSGNFTGSLVTEVIVTPQG